MNKKKLKVGFIGCVESSRIALETLVSLNFVEVTAVITKYKSGINADFVDLSKICIELNIPFHHEEAVKKENSIRFFEQFELDVIYCIGWSYLLRESYLNMSRFGVVGFHPAKLPQNRGRHPIIWAIALGLEETASTFFKMELDVDSGPIISQEPIKIDIMDDAKSLYNKILCKVEMQIINFTREIYEDRVNLRPQNNTEANSWRKRSRKDGLIDWRMSPKSIYDLIRALAPPYPGAEFFYNGQYYVVTKGYLLLDKYPNNIEPGAILERKHDSMIVKLTGYDAIVLTNLSFDTALFGDYL